MARGTFAPGAHGRTSGGLDSGARPRWVRRRYREGARETRSRCLARLRDVGSVWGCRDRLSDWRYLSGGSRRMGVAHGLLNTIGLVLSVVSLILRATGRRNAGRLAFLTG